MPAALTVVIPSFQQAEFLEQTLLSVLQQEPLVDCGLSRRLGTDCGNGTAAAGVEIIVQDGGSTDGSVEILKKYGGRIQWTSAPDGGQTAAINTGLRKAQGEIVCYLNSDDLLAPDAVRTVLRFFETHSEIDLVYGSADLIDQHGIKIGQYPVEPWDYERLFETCFIAQPACFWRRRLHDRIGWFDESLHFAMDYDFWLRAGAVARAAQIPETLAIARRHTDAKTVKRRGDSFEESFRVMLKHLGTDRRISRRWILALAQARAERHLRGKHNPAAWLRFVRDYCGEARRITLGHPCREPLRLASSILPHCISAWKKTRRPA